MSADKGGKESPGDRLPLRWGVIIAVAAGAGIGGGALGGALVGVGLGIAVAGLLSTILGD